MTEVTPRCEHFDMCGGCSEQHLSTATQLENKEQALIEALKAEGIENYQVLPALTDEEPWYYRYRARMSVSYVAKKGRVLVGFREAKNGRFVTDMQRCYILHERVGQSLEALSALIASMSNPKAFPQIEVVAGDSDIGLIFRHLEAITEEDKDKLKAFSDTTGMRIYLQSKGLDTIKLFYPEGDMALSYSLPEQGVHYQFLATDFTQVNLSINRKMVTQALAVLKPGPEDTVLDLFCGLGNFSLPLAKQAKNVVGLEYSETMVQRAEANAKLNAIDNTTFYARDLSKPNALAELHATKILLDPPRTGAEQIVKEIEVINPNDILYVSCNPKTFVRDAAILVHDKGYKLDKVGIMNMFPHTSHSEVMGLFTKG